jgi:anti-anti-sigma factor
MIKQTLKPMPELVPGAAVSGDALGVHVEVRPGVPTVAQISGEIDIASAAWLREMLLLAIQRHGPVIDVDLQGVTPLDCSGVNALLATARRAGLEGGRMRVIRPSAQALRIIAAPMTVPWCKDHRPFDPAASRRANCRANSCRANS